MNPSLPLVLSLVSVLLISACNSKNAKPDEAETVMVNAKDIRLGPVQHNSLSAEQLNDIQKIYSTFSEVNPSTLDETITNFKRDANPDKEIAIWLHMADAYRNFITSQNSAVAPEKKVEAYKLILLRSMMPDEEALQSAQVKCLSEVETTQVLSRYNETFSPLKEGADKTNNR